MDFWNKTYRKSRLRVFKTIKILFLFFIFTQLNVFAQLVKYNLSQDQSRNISENVDTSIKSSKNARQEAENVKIKAGVSIIIASGNNPRCSGDNTPITFEAIPVNEGKNPNYEWFVSGVLQQSDSNKTFILSSPINGQQVNCRLTSNSACVVQPNVLSNIISIVDSTSLVPTISIEVSSGDNPACNGRGDTPICFKANLEKCGISPSIKWLYNGTVVSAATGIEYCRDSMSNRSFVRCVVQPSISCATKTSDSSNTIFRTLVRNMIPKVSMKLLNITSDSSCLNRIYNFQAIPINQGNSPVYRWYINNQLVATTPNPNFSKELPNNGDEVYMEMQSSLTCANPKIIESSSFIKADTILGNSLPFFDDFANYKSSIPDINKWVKNGGTYINSTLSVDSPSFNAASFDGLRQNGSPYDSVNVTARGVTDNLTSLPIDLSTISGNLKLVFYWQPQGIGEIPETSQGDNLSLYFKSKTGDWILKWQKFGTSLKPFEKAVIDVADSANNIFLHSGFQFKFESRGRLSGMYDIWNVDYIFLGMVNSTIVSFNDRAFSTAPSIKFNEYTSMPLSHFLLNPSGELKNMNVSSKLNNLTAINSLVIATTKAGFYGANDTLLLGLDDETFIINSDTFGIINQKTFNSNPIPIEAKPPFELKTTFSVSGDFDFLDGNQIAYTQNNSVTGVNILDNFYAYDDGSTEYALGLNQKFAVLAYKFNLRKKDTLRQIAISHVKLGKVVNGLSFNISVWKKLPSNPGSNVIGADLLFKKNYLVKYKSVNGFSVYELDTPLILEDDFYVGYQQVSDDVIAIGWDKNTNSSEKIYYAVSTTWENYADVNTFDGAGSLMIRPVFGSYRYTSLEDEIQENDLNVTIYPNPVERSFCVNETFDKIILIDLSGQSIWENVSKNERCLELPSSILSGFYIAQIEIKGRIYFRKIIVR
jgi:hypothetical protein